jgi:hypothetical protein
LCAPGTKILATSVRIFRTEDIIISPLTEVVVTSTDNTTFIFQPAAPAYLGGENQTVNYSVNLTTDIKKANGSNAFSLSTGFTWGFEVSNELDLISPQIKEFDKNDAHFTTYYEYLKDAFANTDVPLFTSFKLDNHQNVQLGFEVGSYDEMQKVIGFVESKLFLRHFKTLSIKAASFSQNLGSEKNTLQFVGIIKNVDSEI